MVSLVLAAAVALVALLGACVCGDEKFDVEAMIEMKRNGDPVLAPGKEYFVYTQTYYEGTDTSIGKAFIQDLSGSGTAVEICSEASHPGNTTWLDDNVILLTGYGAEGTNQIWSYNVSSSTCTQLTHFDLSIDNMKVAPTQNFVVFSAEVYYKMNFAETAAREAAWNSRPYQVYRWTTPYVRHWDSYIEADKFYHLFLSQMTYDATTGTVTIQSGEPRDLMYDLASDSPLRPFGDSTQFDISPNGTQVSFITQTGPERAWNTNDMLYVSSFDITDGQDNMIITTECKTCQEAGYKYYNSRAATPLYITENVLLFLGMEEEKSESDQARLVQYNVTTNEYDFLTNGFFYTISSYVLDTETLDTSDGIDNPTFELYLVVSHYARERIFLFKSSNQSYKLLSRDGTISGVNVHSRTDDHVTFVYALNTFTFPTETFMSTYYFSTREFTDTVQLTHDNDDILANYDIITPGEFVTKNATDNEIVQHYYFLPSNYDANNPPPLILYIHGGPESPWYDGWSFRWNPQAWVSQGYSMVLTNFHGSDSFGQDFTDSILGNWFGLMYDDIKDGMQYMIDNKYGDPNRIGTAGASFGCNTIFWILGHNDVNSIVNVCHDGVFDTRLSATDTEELYFPIREFGGFVFDEESRADYDAKNPSLFVENWTTPTLVIHGGQDFRIPESHGIGAFQSLRRRDIEARFLYFPTQSHWVYAPQESVVWHKTVLQWLADHLNPDN